MMMGLVIWFDFWKLMGLKTFGAYSNANPNVKHIERITSIPSQFCAMEIPTCI